MSAIIDLEECDGCGSCESACPQDAISIQDEQPVVNREACRECGECVEACPTEAIELNEADDDLAGFPAVIQHLDGSDGGRDRGFHLSSSVGSRYYISAYLDAEELDAWFGPETAELLRTLEPDEGVHCVLMPHFDRPLTRHERSTINEHDAGTALTLEELKQRKLAKGA